MDNVIGKKLGLYQVIEPLGEGGMATVYKGYQPGVDRYVALKILPKRLAEDPKFIGRFEQEAKIVAQLQHPHILPVFDYGESGGYTYIVMPYIQGGTLADLLHGNQIPLTQTRTIISQVADALDYAHGKGLLHRDIKPSNVLIDESGNCLLADFGIAKIFSSTSRFTSTGGTIGTPDYMSPEQGQGHRLDIRSDIYSLGVILYEMATGRVPFKAETPLATVMKHIHDPLPAPRSFNSALPESIELVILRALAKEPANRFPTAGDLANSLRAAAGSVGIEHTQIETPLVAAAVADQESAKTKDKSSSKWLLPLGIFFGLLLLLGLFTLISDVLDINTFVGQSPTILASPLPSTVPGAFTNTVVPLTDTPATKEVRPSPTTETPIPVPTVTEARVPTTTPTITLVHTVLYDRDVIFHLGDESIDDEDWSSLYDECLDINFTKNFAIQTLTLELKTFGAESQNTISLNGNIAAILPQQLIESSDPNARPNEWTDVLQIDIPTGATIDGINTLAICAALVQNPEFLGDKDDFQLRNIRLIAN